jgi:glyoxylase-like metal-dependent hydrolase (beta-lactamase superfamily II)
MAAYMRSLEKLLGRDETTYLPGHGPAITDPRPLVQAFIQHRRERSAAILRRLAEGPATVPQIVNAVYAGLAPGLRGAAGLSVLAHLIELAEAGQVEGDGSLSLEVRYRLANGRARET